MSEPSLTFVDPFGGRSIDYTTLKAGLKELQPGLTFDDGSGQVIYMFSEGKMRAGIYYNGRYLSAVERGPMPELTVYDGYAWQQVPAHIDEVLESAKDDPKYFFQEIVVNKTMDPKRHWILTQWVGAEGARVIKNNRGAETLVVLMPNDDIVISTPMKLVLLPTIAIRIGWREVFERLLREKIPGITKQSIERKFGVDMSGPSRYDLQLQVATGDLPRMLAD